MKIQARPNQPTGYMSYIEDELFCLVKTFIDNVHKGHKLSPKSIAKPSIKNSLAPWVKEVIRNSDIDRAIFHSTRKYQTVQFIN